MVAHAYFIAFYLTWCERITIAHLIVPLSPCNWCYLVEKLLCLSLLASDLSFLVSSDGVLFNASFLEVRFTEDRCVMLHALYILLQDAVSYFRTKPQAPLACRIGDIVCLRVRASSRPRHKNATNHQYEAQVLSVHHTISSLRCVCDSLYCYAHVCLVFWHV